jgi:hypothetical protein
VHRDHPIQAELERLERLELPVTLAQLEEPAEQVPRTRAKEVTQDHRVIQVPPAQLVEPEVQAQQVTLVTQDQLVAQVARVARVALAQLETREIPAVLVQLIRVQLVQQVVRVRRETRETQEQLAEQVELDQEALEAPLEFRAKLVQLA